MSALLQNSALLTRLPLFEVESLSRFRQKRERSIAIELQSLSTPQNGFNKSVCLPFMEAWDALMFRNEDWAAEEAGADDCMSNFQFILRYEGNIEKPGIRKSRKCANTSRAT
jgi:hypothetical protein